MPQNLTKTLLLFLFSLILFFIFAVSFEILTLEYLLDIKNYFQIFFIIFALSMSVLTLIPISLSKNVPNYFYFFISFLVLAGTTVYLVFPKQKNFALISAGLILLFLAFSILKSKRSAENYLKTPVYAQMLRSYHYMSIFLSLLLVLSFYFFAHLSLENPKLDSFLDDLVEQTAKGLINLENFSLEEENLQNQITEEDLSGILDNQNLNTSQIEGLLQNQDFNLENLRDEQQVSIEDLQQGTIQEAKSATKNQIGSYLSEYNKEIKIFLTLVLYGYLKLFFSIAGFFLVPFNYLIYKTLFYFGIYQNQKETVATEKLTI